MCLKQLFQGALGVACLPNMYNVFLDFGIAETPSRIFETPPEIFIMKQKTKSSQYTLEYLKNRKHVRFSIEVAQHEWKFGRKRNAA